MKKNNRILILGKDISHDFSPYEERFLKALWDYRNEVVSYDQLVDDVYLNPNDKFSLWGIAKLAQRVRDKLEDYGIPRDTIQTVRGEGFCLKMGLNQYS